MSLRFFLKLVVILAILVGVAFAGVHYLRREAVVVAAKRSTAVDSVTGTVTVKAERRAEVRSEVSGRVANSNLVLAGRVSEGDVLVELDSRSIELEIERLEGQLEANRRTLEAGSSSRFELENQRDAFAYKERLFERNSVSRAELDRQRREIQRLEQQIELEQVRLEQDQATLENSIQSRKIRLEQMTLRSPVDGIVNAIYAFPGDLITGGAAVAEIVSLEREVEAKIGEEYIAKVGIGAEADVRLQPYGNQMFPAKVVKILPAADSQTQRYSVFLEVELEPERLAPGVTGETSIVIDERTNAIIVPRTALFGNNILVVKDGRVELREVEAGFRATNEVEILSGLQEGELVIAEQVDRFRGGDKVRARFPERE